MVRSSSAISDRMFQFSALRRNAGPSVIIEVALGVSLPFLDTAAAAVCRVGVGVLS